MTELLIPSGKLKSRKLELPAGEILIGRDESCQIRLASTEISRQHCRLRCGPEGIYILDLGSRNGTYVNNASIQQEILLKPGDLIRVGPLELMVPGSAAAQPAPAAASPAVPRHRANPEAEPEEPMPLLRKTAVAEKPLSEAAKSNRGSARAKKATDDDIASWLSDDESMTSSGPGDTTIIPGVKKPISPPEAAPPAPDAKPPVETTHEAQKKPRTVQEQAAEIIRRHHENLKKKRMQ